MFEKKIWKDRISAMPNRRTIDDGITVKTVTVARAEGAVTEPGDSFNAANMNDLEGRIEEGINAVTPREVASTTGNPCTFDTDLADNLVSLTAEIVATGGNGTPDNPIPINGYTEANITRCGVNIWDEETRNGYYNTNGTFTADSNYLASKNYIPVVQNTVYHFESAGGKFGRLCWYDKDKTFVSTIVPQSESKNILSPANASYLQFDMQGAYGTTYKHDISILYPSDTTPAYHPYTGNTYTIDFGQTVYGGVLDVTRGKLAVTHGYITLDGTQTLVITNWRPNTNTVGWAYPYSLTQNAFVPDGSVPDIISNCLTAVKYNSLFADDVEGVGTYASDSYGLFVRIADTTLTTESAINTYLANNPIQVRFKLSTPFDIDLTPVQISALVGTNNIISDLGGDVEVRYYKTVNYKTELSELEDVQITSPSNGQILKFNGTKWVNGQGGKHNYSTSEQVVGTWIDGETLYEKTIILRENRVDKYPYSNYLYAVGLTGVDKVWLTGVYAKRGSAGNTDYTDILSNAADVVIVFNHTDGSIYFKDTFDPTDVIVIIRYTKAST